MKNPVTFHCNNNTEVHDHRCNPKLKIRHYHHNNTMIIVKFIIIIEILTNLTIYNFDYTVIIIRYDYKNIIIFCKVHNYNYKPNEFESSLLSVQVIIKSELSL